MKRPMRDIIVVVPGILGSTLRLDDREIWGLEARTVILNLFTLGRNVRQLQLPDGIGHDDPKDGVTVGRLMPSAQIIPGFWNIVDGYTELTRFLKARFDVVSPSDIEPGNFIEFPYDWRLSNQLNGNRLERRIVPELDRWRRLPGNSDAKFIFICHSMGGLIARWYIEALGGKDLTRKLITIGTPFQGSINALDSLVNGFAVGIGRVGLNLDCLLRSMPSVYQLLPTFKCVDGGHRMVSLDEIDIPNISNRNILEARAFHSRVSAKVDPVATYQTYALKGVAQPTAQSVKIESMKSITLKTYNGIDMGGDGTVPRASSHPPEWKSEDASIYYGEQHGSLQCNTDTLYQVFGILTDQLGGFMGGNRIGLEVPDVVAAGNPLVISASSEECDPTLLILLELLDESGTVCTDIVMDSRGDGTYAAVLDYPSVGAYKVRASSASSSRSIDPVTGITIVWDEASTDANL